LPPGLPWRRSFRGYALSIPPTGAFPLPGRPDAAVSTGRVEEVRQIGT